MKTYEVSLLLVFLAAILELGLQSLFQSRSFFLPFFSAIVVAAWYGGLGSGIFATVSSIAVLEFFFAKAPYATTLVEKNIQLLLFVIAGGLVSWLSQTLRETGEVSRFKASVFSQLGEMAVIVNSEGKIIYWNKNAEKLYGKRPIEVYDKIFEDVAGYTGDKRRSVSALYPVVLNQKQWNVEQIHTKKTGEEICMELTLSLIKDKETYGDCILILGHDITKRKKTEEVQHFLAEADVKIASSLDYHAILKKVASLSVPHIADWCTTDLKEGDSLLSVSTVHRTITRIKLVQEFRKIFLLDREAPVNIFKALESQKAQCILNVRKSVRKLKGKSKHYELLHNFKVSGIIIVPLVIRERALGAITFISAESGRHFERYHQELAENLALRTAVALDNAQLYLKTQEAVRAREEFLSLASHELKTPLTSLLLQLQIVLRSIQTDPLATLSINRLLDLLKNAEHQSKKLSNLIANLLNVSRITGGRLNLQKENVDLVHIVERSLEGFDQEFKNSSTSVRKVYPKSPIVGHWDPLQLEQVVTNLISNAIKYGKNKPIEIRTEKTGSSAKIIVKDRGIGIRPERMDKIFKPFSRATENPQYQGLGVGLYIVRQIVEAHKGKVFVESTPGRGSIFTVELPLSENE